MQSFRPNVPAAPASTFRCDQCHHISLIPADWLEEPICPHCLHTSALEGLTTLAAVRLVIGVLLFLCGFLIGAH